jgi:hypothetical protein
MPRTGFEPATPATERPQNYASDRAARGIGALAYRRMEINICLNGSFDFEKCTT